jgi:hypothetical protein
VNVRRSVVVLLALSACRFPELPHLQGDGGDDDDGSMQGGRTEVARVPVTPNRDVDLLFVIDDSPSMLDKQANLKAAFPAFIAEVNRLEGGLPNVHIGVVTSDLGSKGSLDAAPGPGIGSGPGSCAGEGKSGNLQTNGSTLINGSFITDVANGGGGRTTNYTGTLADAFAAIASVGAGGCGFEQHLEAAKRALSNNPANAGFLRSNAGLAVIVLADEDDCSMSHSTLLSSDVTMYGPLQSFRCTRFGVTCDVGGTTSDEMNMLGPKSSCHSTVGSAHLTNVADYASFFSGLKPDARYITFAAIAGPSTPVIVEERVPPGGGTAINAVAHSCQYTGATGPEVGDPSVRIQELASLFPGSTFEDVCSPSLSQQLIEVGRAVRALVGDTCLRKDIATPADCVVIDQVGTNKTVIPKCGSASTDCYTLVADPTRCSTPSHLRLEITRSSAPPANTVTVVSCKL